MLKSVTEFAAFIEQSISTGFFVQDIAAGFDQIAIERRTRGADGSSTQKQADNYQMDQGAEHIVGVLQIFTRCKHFQDRGVRRETAAVVLH
jgi:23S rRNA maturation mini-RNase III